ncbi:MAG TPA: M1 family metallopeptidase [Bacteroidales bacterium]|nr:hypothetical protein [Bacteroidales bacterium]HPI29793.1 M1 family metallopeptidase [Bacteroidales bacterium]
MIKHYLRFIFSASVIMMMCGPYAETVSAQESLFLSKEIAQAIRSGTRTTDGNPGKKYWQNTADYKIKVKFFPETGYVEGQEEITYYNNSPDTLKTLVIRLYQDLFKKGAARTLDVYPVDLTDGVLIKQVMNNGRTISAKAEDNRITRRGTNMYVTLNDPLNTKASTKITIDWSFRMPSKTQIRMGTYDSTSFFIGQWYPQIAVYDDISGWDTRDYTGLAEFYNDFGNFDVEISVPGKYVVWATGNLVNPGDLLNEPYLAKYREALSSSETVTIALPDDYNKGNVTKQGAWNTWKYKADNVSDFAFALSDHFVWEGCSIEAGTGGRKVFIQTAYNAKHSDYKEVIAIARKTILFLSEKLPGVPYPFPCMSIFDGADGMEYPMMTNVGSSEDRGDVVYAHSHEITHTYFPFYVGTNETKYGWMDESMAVFLPEALQKEIEPTKDVASYTTHVYSYYGGREFEPAVMTPTYYLTPEIYFILNYGKAEQILRLLEIQLGKDVFSKCLKGFMDSWKYKHPTPYDFFNCFNQISGQDLTWFWKPWYFEQGFPDLTISSATYEAGKCTVEIKNSGTLPLPVYLLFDTENGEKIRYDLPADTWKDGKNITIVTLEIKQKVTKITLGNSQVPDGNPSDNNFKIK